MRKELEEMFEVFDNTYETPIDKCLKLWSASSIHKLFTFTQTI